MVIVGGRMLFAAVCIWACQFFVYLHEGDWTETTWLDLAVLAGISHWTYKLHAFEDAVLLFLKTPIALELAGFGLLTIWIGCWGESRRVARG